MHDRAASAGICCMTTSTAAAGILRSRRVRRIPGAGHCREEPVALGAIGGLRLQPLEKSRMALSGGVSVRRERHGVARTRERAKRAKVTSVARSRDPLSRRENAAEISLALSFWWAGVSGYPREDDETKRLTGYGEDLRKQIAARRDVPAQPVIAGTESLFQRGCVMATKDPSRFWFVTSLDWKERDRVHGAGSQTRVTRSDEGRMQRQLLLFWGWGPRRDARKPVYGSM